MAKFTKSEAKKSLSEGISLLQKSDDDFLWAEFDEISKFYNLGYKLVNQEKSNIFKSK
jgi:hypothetical protein